MLYVHAADRADHLVARLVDVLREPLPDPLATEVVAVHSRGIERWLAQRLSTVLGARDGRGDGVAANLDHPFPHRLTRRAVAAALGTDPDDDPWHRDRLAWRILGVLAADGAPRSFGPLSGDAGPRRLGAARHVAGLLGRYLAHRPEMLATWLDRSAADLDAGGRSLAEAHRWQADLVRALVADGLHDPVARHAEAVRRLRSGGVELDLPGRLSVFGLTALPARQLAVLEALAVHRDVHLLVLHPSRVLWDAVREVVPDEPGHPTPASHLLPARTSTSAQEAAVATSPGPRAVPAARARADVQAAVAGAPRWPTLRRDDPTAGLARNPLLASWGRDVRELQLALPAASWGSPVADDAAEPRTTLLERLQADVRADRPVALTPEDPHLPELAPDDRSVEFHDVHGDLRQVEVLRDVLLHALAGPARDGRPPLEPRDVIVMCPDVERFAPLVRAVLGEGDAVQGQHRPEDHRSDPTAQLRVRLADRALREVNPLLDVASELLVLTTARRTSVEVLSLLSSEPVARRFELDDDQLGRLAQWVAAAQVRWGLDASDRVAAGLPPIAEHTFTAGLDRMALGLAMADEDLRSVGGVVPLGDVEGDDADLVGRLAEFLERLCTALDRLSTPQPIAGWCTAVADAVDALALADPRADWQRQQLHRVLDDLTAEAAGTGAGTELQVDEVRALLRSRLTGAPTRSGHRSGAVTVSTLVPMRSVPHGLVVLLGLDDGRFPRRVVHDADDLLVRQPVVGDREARSEDRQLLLDALMAAEERLVVIHAGRDVRTNAELPPAVPVTELREVVDRTVRPPAAAGGHAPGVRASDHLTVRHHLHAHHPAAFVADGLGAQDGPWSFDATLLEAARAGLEPERSPRRRLVDQPLPARPTEDVVALDDLVAFLAHPVRHFLRTRLELGLGWVADELATEMPTELSGLERWRVGDALLEAWRAEEDPQDALRVLRGRGLLPLRADVDGLADEVRAIVDDVVHLATDAGLGPGSRRSVDVDVTLPDGRRVVGVVPHVHGWVLDQAGFGRAKGTHRATAWTRWLALLAGTGHDHWSAVTIGARRTRDAWRVERHLLGVDRLLRHADTDDATAAATDLLARLVDLRDRGLVAPPPLYAETSADLAGKVARRWSLDRSYTWTTRPHGFAREDRDPHHTLVHGCVLPFDALLAEPAVGDEVDWPGAEHSRVVAWALRLWAPVEAVERWARA